MTAQLIELRPVTTNVRYEGSIAELRGRRGWVEQVGHYNGELRYDVSLVGADGQRSARLVQVRPESIVID